MAKLSKALLTLLLDKKARESIKRQPPSQQAMADAEAQAEALARALTGETQPVNPAQMNAQRAYGPQEPHPSPQEIHDRLDQAQQKVAQKRGTPERQRLIEEARRVRASKQSVLDELSEEQRLKLQALAMKTMMGQK